MSQTPTVQDGVAAAHEASARGGDQAAYEFPKAVAGLEVTEFNGPQPYALLGLLGTRHFRASHGTAVALRAMDGSRSITQLSETLGLPDERLRALVGHLHQLGLLENSAAKRNYTPTGAADTGLPTWLRWIVFANVDIASPARVVALMYRTFRLQTLLGRPGIMIFGILIVAALMVVAQRYHLIVDGFDPGVDGRWLWLVPVAVLTKRIVHEMGHALACYHYTGRVGKMGIGLFFFLPVLYTDVSSAWRIPSRRSRIWVHAGGLVGELILLCCAILFLHAFPGHPGTRVVAISLMAVVALSVFLNTNPLLKLDGYFIASDLFGVHNLRERAFGILFSEIRRFLRERGFKVADGGYQNLRDRLHRGLMVYAVAALCYTSAMFGWAAIRLAGWLDSHEMPLALVILPYALGLGILIVFIRYIWKRSRTSSNQKF